MNEQVWVAEVIVVGAGAAGLLAARQLASAGMTVMVIEQDAIGSAQSNHSHGYLHRGHIYMRPSSSLVENLVEGSDRWQELLSEAGVQAVTESSFIGFGNAYDAEVAARSWSAGGLNFSRAECPRSLLESKLKTVFETEEKTYNFTDWLAAASASLYAEENVDFLRARVLSLERQNDFVRGVNVEGPDGRLITLSSSYVVLCAGVGNLGIASTVTRYRGHALNRSSLMLVVENPDLEEISFVAHGHEARGLFVVSRASDTGTTWLISNYVSFSSEIISEASIGLWLRDVRRTLSTHTVALHNRQSRWAYYLAPKGELRNLRSTMDSHTVQRYGLGNLLVASPTKLTLAPLLAESIVQSLHMKLQPLPKPSGMSAFSSWDDHVPLSPEMWKGVQFQPIRSLMAI